MLRIPAMGIGFELDIDHSEIYGYLSHGEPAHSPTWSVSVQCGPAHLLPLEDESEEDLRERREWFEFASGEGCHASVSGLVIPVKSWRDLAGQRVSAEFEHSHPIMPHVPGEFYFEAHHWLANRNQIEFGSRRNNVFPIRWNFMAEDDEGNTSEVEVEADIPFRSFRVGFEKPGELSVPAAVQAVTRFAAEDELGEPSESFGRYVDIPLLGDD